MFDNGYYQGLYFARYVSLALGLASFAEAAITMAP
jgi:hypothetical protein